MAAPRRVLPGKAYLITRRCYQRTFRLRPSPRTNQAFAYCLAVAARKTGVVIHAVCVMSNHHHAVVTDVDGKLPDFLRELHRTTAKVLNASQGQWENLWSAEQANAVWLADAEDMLRKIAYAVANPVEAGLVETPAAWPGINLWGEKRVVVSRPDEYFDPFGEAPEQIELVVTEPDVARRQPDWRQRLAAEIGRLVAEAHRAAKAVGWRFLGKRAVLEACFVARAKSYEIKRGFVPKVAAGNRELRAALVGVYRRFHAGYRAALDAWRAGDRAAVFPTGTWWMRVHHAAVVAPAPA